MLGDSVTTDHISTSRLDQGRLARLGATCPRTVWSGADFNSYGSRRGNHEVMIRGTFANIRLRNQLLDGVEGGFTRNFLGESGEPVAIFDAAQAYAEAGVPLVLLAGREYGSGSSRDWAAKGTSLLGVKAVIAQSYERIHRSNLIGMGVLPLQFPSGESAESLGLDGTEQWRWAAYEPGDLDPTLYRRRRDAGQGLPARRARTTTSPFTASTAFAPFFIRRFGDERLQGISEDFGNVRALTANGFEQDRRFFNALTKGDMEERSRARSRTRLSGPGHRRSP